jgi:hypothetical protein
MHIHEFSYYVHQLYIEFSTKEDGEDFYRILELDYKDVIYYSSDIIHESDIFDFDENSIIDLINGYLKENDLPEQLTL